MDLSIIIVHYKTPDLLLNCLETVFQQTRQVAFEVLVVDNLSNDDTEAKLKHRFPIVKWIQMNYNAGFARANNAGIAASKGRNILLLNSDTLIINSAIDNCVQSFENSTHLACGVQLLNADMTAQISGNYAMKGGLNYLLPLPFLGNFLKGIANIMKVHKPNIPDATSEVEVDWINGAFLMVKRIAVDKAGLLDEDFFLYAEEAEWCSRIKLDGSLAIYGQYRIIHLQGATSNKTFDSVSAGYQNLFDRKGLQIMLSNFVRIRKEFAVGWFLFSLMMFIIEIPVFLIGVIFTSISEERQYTFQDFSGYVRNVWRIITFTPKIISGKPYFYKVL